MKKQEKPEVPRLPQEIKSLNGKSGKRLSQCIDTLCDLLDDKKPSNEDKEAQE